MNLKTVWTEGDFVLLMSEEPEGYSGNREYYGYELRYKGTPIFQGSDYSPSPLHGPYSRESIANLLGFLSVKPGDVDPEYFKDYTPDQMRFVTEHGEELSVHVWDQEALVNSYRGRATGWQLLNRWPGGFYQCPRVSGTAGNAVPRTGRATAKSGSGQSGRPDPGGYRIRVFHL